MPSAKNRASNKAASFGSCLYSTRLFTSLNPTSPHRMILNLIIVVGLTPILGAKLILNHKSFPDTGSIGSSGSLIQPRSYTVRDLSLKSSCGEVDGLNTFMLTLGRKKKNKCSIIKLI